MIGNMIPNQVKSPSMYEFSTINERGSVDRIKIPFAHISTFEILTSRC